jgi:hypothetical protein
MGQHNGQQPIRVLERHQSAGARLISAELSHPIEKCGVLQRNGKRLPTGLRDATVKGRGIAKLRLALRQLFPESPAATICLGQLSGRARHRTQAGGIGHGAVLQEDKVAVIHGNHFAFVPPQATDAGHDELAVFGLVIEVCHLAIRDQTDALGREPRLQGQNQRVVLVVEGSLDARKSFDAGKLGQEAVAGNA